LYYPILAPTFSARNDHGLSDRSPGYPDTERFKFLKSVSNHSHGCVEDKWGKYYAAFGMMPGHKQDV
jgi:hypothetical protein